MARMLNRSQKAFVLALLVTIVLAFLPARWLGWTSDIANILSVPLMPFRDLGTSISAWLLPPSPSTPPRLAGAEQEQILDELERMERLYHASELRVKDLEEQLEQLQGVPVDELRTPVTRITARVTARNPRDRAGLIEINRGRRAGVTPGTIAVYGGAHLVGRVIDVGMHNSFLMPAVNPDSELIRAAVLPADDPEMNIRQAPTVLLDPVGDGTFSAEIERTLDMTVPVAEGDLVRLADPHWPAAAQATIVGEIESIRSDIGGTLRDRLVVRPRYHAMQLDRVILLIEENE